MYRIRFIPSLRSPHALLSHEGRWVGGGPRELCSPPDGADAFVVPKCGCFNWTGADVINFRKVSLTEHGCGQKGIGHKARNCFVLDMMGWRRAEESFKCTTTFEVNNLNFLN